MGCLVCGCWIGFGDGSSVFALSVVVAVVCILWIRWFEQLSDGVGLRRGFLILVFGLLLEHAVWRLWLWLLHSGSFWLLGSGVWCGFW